MRTLGKVAGSILLGLMAGSMPDGVRAAEVLVPEPQSGAVVDVLLQMSSPEATGFAWGLPRSALAASGQVRASADFSARCAADLQSPDRSDCTGFVPITSGGFARAYYATERDGLLMVESNATLFDCARFEDIASPAGAHRAELARLGWRYLRRERRPEGADKVVESQLYGRNGVGVELAFIKVQSRNVCGVQSFVSKQM